MYLKLQHSRTIIYKLMNMVNALSIHCFFLHERTSTTIKKVFINTKEPGGDQVLFI
jgi:hypothetical protein